MTYQFGFQARLFVEDCVRCQQFGWDFFGILLWFPSVFCWFPWRFRNNATVRDNFPPQIPRWGLIQLWEEVALFLPEDLEKFAAVHILQTRHVLRIHQVFMAHFCLAKRNYQETTSSCEGPKGGLTSLFFRTPGVVANGQFMFNP